MTARTVSARDLETMAHAAHEHVELPGPEGGWATATINGRCYRALVAPVPVLHLGQVRCPECGMGATPNSRGVRSHVDPTGRLCPNRDLTGGTP